MLQHHRNPSRDGVYVDSKFSTSGAAGIHLDATFKGNVTGDVYAQPLYVENGPNNAEAFIVATESNHVADGTGSLSNPPFGTPTTGKTPCGNIDPLGITGTPVIDMSSRIDSFPDARTTPDNGNTMNHLVYAISIDDVDAGDADGPST